MDDFAAQLLRELADSRRRLAHLETIEQISVGGAGGAAPADAPYVVMALSGILTDERILTAGNNLVLTDGGAGGNATLAWDPARLLLVATANAEYASIQAAINAAVAGGAGPATPWVVLVCPGTYTEDLVLADGVHVVGLDWLACILVGQVLGAACALHNFTVQYVELAAGSTSAALTGPAAGDFYLDHVRVDCTMAVAGGQLAALAAAPGAVAARIYTYHCRLTATRTGALAYGVYVPDDGTAVWLYYSYIFGSTADLCNMAA